MKAQRGITFITAPLGWRSAAVLLTALAAIWQLAMPTELPLSGFPPETSAAAPTAAERSAAVSPAYPAIAEHPLFYPTRQPWVAPELKPAPPPPPAQVSTAVHPLQKYQLVGVMISSGARTALLRSPDGKTAAISEGQNLSGWILREISHDALHFESSDAVYDIKFPTPRWPRN